MSHLKRIRSNKAWPLKKRKGIKFIARPMPGPHSLENCITLNVILKDVVRYAKTTREAKKILNKGNLLVNNKVRKSHIFPVGILDTISFVELGEYYRVLYDKKGKFSLIKIKKDETENKLVKIVNKTILKKMRTQLNFHDGTNMLVDKNIYKNGDTLLLNNGNILKHIKFEKNSLVYLIGGKHNGKIGIIEDIKESSAIDDGQIILKIGKENITTKKDFAFVIDKLLQNE